MYSFEYRKLGTLARSQSFDQSSRVGEQARHAAQERPAARATASLPAPPARAGGGADPDRPRSRPDATPAPRAPVVAARHPDRPAVGLRRNNSSLAFPF